MFHIPAIDEEELMSSFFLCRLRLSYESLNTAERRIYLYRQQHLVETLAKHIDDTLSEATRTEVYQFGAIAMQREGDVGIDESDAFVCRKDIVQFGGIGLQELTSCRDIEEEVVNNEVTAYWTRDRLLLHHL